MKKRDMTIAELREFDGIKNDGRILMAVNGYIFDVTRGKKFYGPGQYAESNLLKCIKNLGLRKRSRMLQVSCEPDAHLCILWALARL